MLPQKELLPLTGYVHGGCSPIGMKKQFPTFADATIADGETVCFSGGRVGLQRRSVSSLQDDKLQSNIVARNGLQICHCEEAGGRRGNLGKAFAVRTSRR